MKNLKNDNQITVEIYGFRVNFQMRLWKSNDNEIDCVFANYLAV